MKLSNWLTKAELKVIKKRFRNVVEKDPSYLMDKQQFNKLLRRYKELRPDLSRKHNLCVRNVRLLVNHAKKTEQIEKYTGYYLVHGSPRQLGWLDEILDNVLLDCVSRDIL